jgi:hypothetical protein
MYHLLGLFLSTPHPSTRQTASSLITRLLSSSVLFEHDPSEIGIWLEAFETSSQSTSDSSLSTEHETFLQFFDDSLRRCLKTPYKYIEDSLHFLSSSNDDSTPLVPTEVSSPLLLTMLEQLAAKVKAKLLADEEARWVAGFIERIGLGLVGKQRNLDFAREVARRVDAVKEGLGGLNGKLDLLIGKVVVADQSGNGMDVDERTLFSLIYVGLTSAREADAFCSVHQQPRLRAQLPFAPPLSRLRPNLLLSSMPSSPLPSPPSLLPISSRPFLPSETSLPSNAPSNSFSIESPVFLPSPRSNFPALNPARSRLRRPRVLSDASVSCKG